VAVPRWITKFLSEQKLGPRANWTRLGSQAEWSSELAVDTIT